MMAKMMPDPDAQNCNNPSGISCAGAWEGPPPWRSRRRASSAPASRRTARAATPTRDNTHQLDPNYFYPGSECFPSRIPDPMNLSILTQKMASKLSEIWSGCSSRIRIPDPNPDFLPIPDPDVKKATDLGSATMDPGACFGSGWFKWGLWIRC